MLSTKPFLTSTGNMVTSEKFLGYGIKRDTFDPDSSKVGNELFNWSTTALNSSCKPLPILFYESSAPLHLICAWLIQSIIFNLAYLALLSGCIWLPSKMSSWLFVLIDYSS